MLGPLSANGGLTMTQALLAGSHAINAGIAVPGLTIDQRGIYRPQGAAPDIGAFELQLPPVVLEVERHGFHHQPTTLVVTFSQPMDATRAGSTASYRLVWAGPDERIGTHEDRVIPIVSVTYDAALNAVALRPIRRLPLSRVFRLTIRGEPPSGLTDTAGLYLDGNRTLQQGSNYIERISGKLLVNPPAQSRFQVVRPSLRCRRTGPATAR